MYSTALFRLSAIKHQCSKLLTPLYSPTKGQSCGNLPHAIMMTSSTGNISALLAICAGNSPVPGEFPAQRPMTRSFDVFFDLRLNKRLGKQWLETLSSPLWRHCYDDGIIECKFYQAAWKHRWQNAGLVDQSASQTRMTNGLSFVPKIWFISLTFINMTSSRKA